MPEEIFVIIIVAIAAGTFSGVVSQIIGYLKSRSPQQTVSDSSMTTSELENMIQKWITEANKPIVERLDSIERTLEPASTNKATAKKSLLDDMDGYDPFEEEAAAKGKRVKS